MKRSVSRVVLTAGAVAVLGLTAACGGELGKEEGKGEVAMAPMSATQLAKAAVVTSDVKGFEIAAMSEKEVSEGGAPKADRPACQPLAALLGSTFDPVPAASVFLNYAGSDAGADAKPGTGMTGLIRLSSYQKDGAQRTVRELKAAIAACGDGFAVTSDGDRQKISKIAADPAPKAGDEAVAYSAIDQSVGGGGVVKFSVVRSGPHLTAVFGVNIVDPKKSEIPQSVLDRQVAKLESAARG